MKLYSKGGTYPAPLPDRIRLSNGKTRTTTFTKEEIADAGYVEAPEKPVAVYPNKIEWDGTNWFEREPNHKEINDRLSEIKRECDRRLSMTDYKVIKAVELNQSIDSDYRVYRQELRDLYNNVSSINPWNFTWPSIPILDSDLSDSADSAI